MVLSNGEEVNLTDLALSARAHDNQLYIDLDNISGQWPTRDLHIYSVSGNFIYDINGISVNDLNITSSRSSINVEGNVGRNFMDGIDLLYDFNPVNLMEVRNLTGVKIDGSLRANGSIKGSLNAFGGNAVVNGLFFDRSFEDLNLEYSYSDKAIDFGNIDGKIFNSVFKGRGRLDFSRMPERYSYSGTIEHLDLVNVGPDLRTDFTGYADMRGEGLGANSFFMQIDCELDSVRIEDYYFERLTNYGSLFIGEETTVAYGDKSIGTNHILPTSRAARYTGGVWVGKFLKTCTYQKMTAATSREIAEITERQCKLEHMLAHGITARFRIQRYDKS